MRSGGRSRGAALALAAALTLPLSVLAQPAADSGKSTEVSELVVEARKATAVSGVAVKGLCPIPGELVERRLYGRQFDAPARTQGKRTQESPGTRAFILREIADFRSGTPDYAHMGAQMARVTRQSLTELQRWVVCRGAFKDIKFLHVSQYGYDDFEVAFSTGPIEWEVAPLDSHDRVQEAALRFFYPEPVTDQFVDFLKSAERGAPKYGDLTPGAGAAFRAQWDALQAAQKAWGPRKAILFERQEADGSYVYMVTYKARQVVWNVSPFDAKGKFTGLTYAERAAVAAPSPSAIAEPVPGSGEATQVPEGAPAVAPAQGAIAQVAPHSDKSAEVSELVVTARKATALSDLTVQGHCAVPPETRWPNKMFDASPDFENKKIEERPGTRAIILKDITALRRNTRDYEDMNATMAWTARVQFSFTKRQVVCRGAFKDMKFLHVTETGDDDFEVDFTNGPLEWEVKPPNSHQVTEQFAIRFFYPQPVTAQLQDFLNSMQQGQPDYADLTPDAAAKARAQWPALQKALEDWGALRSFYFLRQGDDGSYLYAASFKHREVIWEVAPLDGSGRMTGLQYHAPD